MTQKQFEQYKECAFDIFCRTVIRHESADAFRELAAKAEREVGLSMLSGQEQEALSYTDEYHTFNLTFLVGDLGIPVEDPKVALALERLPPQKRNVLLLHYFHGDTDAEIGERLGRTARAIRQRRTEALKRLKEIMEDLDDDT